MTSQPRTTNWHFSTQDANPSQCCKPSPIQSPSCKVSHAAIEGRQMSRSQFRGRPTTDGTPGCLYYAKAQIINHQGFGVLGGALLIWKIMSWSLPIASLFRANFRELAASREEAISNDYRRGVHSTCRLGTTFVMVFGCLWHGCQNLIMNE